MSALISQKFLYFELTLVQYIFSQQVRTIFVTKYHFYKYCDFFKVCTYCGKQCSSVSTLWTHLRVKHADEEGIEKPTCTICGEEFNIKYKLKKHVALKHGGETFDCFICKARFYLKGKAVAGLGAI